MRPADYEAIMVLPDGLDEIIERIPAQSSEDVRPIEEGKRAFELYYLQRSVIALLGNRQGG